MDEARRDETDAPGLRAVAPRDVLGGCARELVPRAFFRHGAPHARVAERVERARVLQDRLVVVHRVRRGRDDGAPRDARPVAERDVLHRHAVHGHCA